MFSYCGVVESSCFVGNICAIMEESRDDVIDHILYFAFPGCQYRGM
jgi:hypothetical protein